MSEKFKLIDLPGVGEATAMKLEEGGYGTLLALAVASPSEIADSAGLTESVARKVIQFSRDKLDMGFESGMDLLKKRETVIKITTGSSAFDNLIGGGVESNAITEAYGQYGSGKTALAHQLAITAQLPREQKGAEGMVVWIDTEGTFRPERIKQLAELAGLNVEEVLNNIRVVRAFNSDHLLLLAVKVEDLLTKEELPI